jgi:hypothetical protein
MCCGQKRTEFRNSQMQRRTPQHVPGNSRPQTGSVQLHATTTSTPPASISLRYLDNLPIRVRGLVSGTSYEFSNSRPVQPVDSRDASSLLNTRFFRRA